MTEFENVRTINWPTASRYGLLAMGVGQCNKFFSKFVFLQHPFIISLLYLRSSSVADPVYTMMFSCSGAGRKTGDNC